MATGKNDEVQVKEQSQEWANPTNPEQPADARDAEQAQRQLEEAERRKENLSDNDKSNTENKK